jgi:hypothetical protein
VTPRRGRARASASSPSRSPNRNGPGGRKRSSRSAAGPRLLRRHRALLSGRRGTVRAEHPSRPSHSARADRRGANLVVGPAVSASGDRRTDGLRDGNVSSPPRPSRR